MRARSTLGDSAATIANATMARPMMLMALMRPSWKTPRTGSTGMLHKPCLTRGRDRDQFRPVGKSDVNTHPVPD